MKEIVFEVIGHVVREDDAYFVKAHAKIAGNMSTWKHVTIEAMIVRLRSCCVKGIFADLIA